MIVFISSIMLENVKKNDDRKDMGKQLSSTVKVRVEPSLEAKMGTLKILKILWSGARRARGDRSRTSS